MSDTLIINTDGGCTGNPGPGGWAAIIVFPNKKIVQLTGGERQTTNNRMELIAVIKALEKIREMKVESWSIRIKTDSQYVKKGMNEWIHSWIKKGWKSSTGKPVKNKDLWMMLENLSDELDISFEWLKGHAGDFWNEKCDELVEIERNKLSQ